uniref:Uncharacterized protein n=1 Tax=Anguilla anguilla TaxID=7936 RepID=A0A0E9WS50_ANGAN
MSRLNPPSVARTIKNIRIPGTTEACYTHTKSLISSRVYLGSWSYLAVVANNVLKLLTCELSVLGTMYLIFVLLTFFAQLSGTQVLLTWGIQR